MDFGFGTKVVLRTNDFFNGWLNMCLLDEIFKLLGKIDYLDLSSCFAWSYLDFRLHLSWSNERLGGSLNGGKLVYNLIFKMLAPHWFFKKRTQMKRFWMDKYY